MIATRQCQWSIRSLTRQQKSQTTDMNYISPDDNGVPIDEIDRSRSPRYRKTNLQLRVDPLVGFAARDARTTKLAWQAAKARTRLKTPLRHADHGEIGEQLIIDSHNTTCLPRNRWGQNESRTQKAHDFRSKGGQPIEVKTGYGRHSTMVKPEDRLASGGHRATNEAIQKKALVDMDAATGRDDGIVVTTKGNKATDDPRVRESRVSDKLIEEAQNATAKAATLGRLVARNGLRAAGVGAGISIVRNGWLLVEGEMTFGDFLLEVSLDGLIVGIAVAAGTVVGLVAAGAAVSPLIGAAAVGATVGLTAGALNEVVNRVRHRSTGGPCKVAGRIVLGTLVGAAVSASTVCLLEAGVPASLITVVALGLGVAGTVTAVAKKYAPAAVETVVGSITKLASALDIATDRMIKRPGTVATAT